MNFQIVTEVFSRKIFMDSFENEEVKKLQSQLLIAPFSVILFKSLIDIKNSLTEIK